jgi:RNA polymerase sigma-70 factor (ECF subfamily)
VREELCSEAIRLGRLVAELLPEEPEVLGLLALMLLQDSRRAARYTADGDLVLLEEQDRSMWNGSAIREGLELLDRAMLSRRSGEYQLQAAVAALHARAASPDETDWEQIVMLYEELVRRTGSPVVRLNHAVAVAMARGPERGLELIRPLEQAGDLGDYFLLHSAVGDLERRLGRTREARAAYQRALGLATGPSDERFLRRRLSELGA